MPLEKQETAISPCNMAIIWGNGINAHTIVQNVRQLDFAGPIHIIKPKRSQDKVADRLNRFVTSSELSPCTVTALLNEVRSIAPDASKVALFLTDERFHGELAELQIQGQLPMNILVHLGCAYQMNTVLDRLTFCRFLESIGLTPPQTIPGDADPLSTFGCPFILRPRTSWQTDGHRERVEIIKNPRHYKSVLATLQDRAVERSQLCFQELLSTDSRHNISTCGWFSPTREHIYCTRKVLQHPNGKGDGDVVELITPPPGLLDVTQRLLGALSYGGPFELEFVFDTNADSYKVIELNPRFWLQHGLVGSISGFAPVAQYLCMDPLESHLYETNLRCWIHTPYAIYRTIRGDLRSLQYLWSKHTYMPLTIKDTVRLLSSLISSRLSTSHAKDRLTSGNHICNP